MIGYGDFFFDVLWKNIDFFASISDPLLMPAVDPGFAVSLVFYTVLFALTASKGFFRHLFLVLLFSISLLYFRDFSDSVRLSPVKALPGKSFCINEGSGRGRIVQSTLFYNSRNKRAESQMVISLERDLAACKITELSALHLKERIPFEILSELKSRKRFQETTFFLMKPEKYIKTQKETF